MRHCHHLSEIKMGLVLARMLLALSGSCQATFSLCAPLCNMETGDYSLFPTQPGDPPSKMLLRGRGLFIVQDSRTDLCSGILNSRQEALHLTLETGWSSLSPVRG